MVPVTQSVQRVVHVSHLSKTFSGTPLLKDISFSLNSGDHLAILGPGGCGKSTLLKILLGIIPADSGTVEILGKDILSLGTTERQEILRTVGMAFQQGALFDFMTVKENIVFALENMTKITRQEMEDRIEVMLKAVNLPKAGNKLPSELSGGMRRRVGIVRAMVTSPKLALLDEPTAGLDPVTSRIVIDMIHALAAQTGSTLICVTSSVEVAFTFAKTVAILREGKIVANGTWQSLHEHQDPWLTHFLDVRGFIPPQAPSASMDDSKS